jgi:hypothetical protein
MPKVPFTAWLQGPAAIYASSTGQQDTRTGLPYLGTDFQVGYFADLSFDDAAVWNRLYTPPAPYGPGRYRIVKIASDAVVADILPNQPVGWGLGSSVGSLGFTAGSGYTNGTYNLTSSASGAQVAAVAQVVVSGGAIITAQLISGGSGFVTTSAPTFSLTALGAGSGGAVTAQLTASANVVTSLSSVAVSVTSLVRGIALCSPGPTQAQVTAGAYIIIQEAGIAPVLVTTATSTTQGAQANGVSGGTVATVTPAYSALKLGWALTPPVAGQVSPVLLDLPNIPA